jgi:hypothetical protein
MRLSQHASLRVQERTFLRTDDIVEIIKASAYVALGTQGDTTFCLFFSPREEKGKIALVDKKRSVIITIWEGDFFVPGGVKTPDAADYHNAKKKLRDFLFERIKVSEKRRQEEIVRKERINDLRTGTITIARILNGKSKKHLPYYTARLCVLEKDGNIYRPLHEFPRIKIPVSVTTDKVLLIHFLKDKIQSSERIIKESFLEDDNVEYRIFINYNGNRKRGSISTFTAPRYEVAQVLLNPPLSPKILEE